MREEGFKPMVFTGHGLIAAFFIMTTMVAATALRRIRVRAVNLPPPGVAAYLAGMLVLCKSGAALVYGMVLAPPVRFASARLQTRIAVMLVAVALAFPLLRTADLFPTTALVDTASEFSKSVRLAEIRFDCKQKLRERASERFWFGWGRMAAAGFTTRMAAIEAFESEGEFLARGFVFFTRSRCTVRAC